MNTIAILVLGCAILFFGLRWLAADLIIQDLRRAMRDMDADMLEQSDRLATIEARLALTRRWEAIDNDR